MNSIALPLVSLLLLMPLSQAQTTLTLDPAADYKEQLELSLAVTDAA